MGPRSLSDYRGRWLVLFSHPADFTPVCTSEFIALSRRAAAFADAGCDLLALSVDSLYSHIAWIKDIEDRVGVRVPFPILEDPSMVIGRTYGMVDDASTDSATRRPNTPIPHGGFARAGASSAAQSAGPARRTLTPASAWITPGASYGMASAVAPAPVETREAAPAPTSRDPF